jgi:hypothetical protein
MEIKFSHSIFTFRFGWLGCLRRYGATVVAAVLYGVLYSTRFV